MAIIGKIYAAVLIRTIGPTDGTLGSPLREFTTLCYRSSRTSPEEIEAMYGLTAQTNAAQSGTFLVNQIIGCGPGDDEETCMLDTAAYQAIVASAGVSSNVAVAYTASRGGWVGPNDALWSGALGTPESVWAMYPDNPTWAETVETPFGDFGNGTIRYQFLTRWPEDPTLDGTERHLPFATPPTDYINPSLASEDNNPSTGIMYVATLDVTYIFMPVEGEEGEEIPPDEEGDIDEEILLRVWGYTLDAHKHFVLRIGEIATFVYDLTTKQWSEWKSVGRDNWRPHVGMNWVGMGSATVARGFGTNIVCGDDESGTLFVLDPTAGRDDKPDGSTIELFDRIVTGGFSLTARAVVPCNALTLDLSTGAPAVGTSASLSLRVSDDAGHSWLDCGTQSVELNNFSTVVEWRSLGLAKAPGRIFEISDTGAMVRLGRADLR